MVGKLHIADEVFMNPEISLEGQLVENVLKELEDEFSRRIIPTNTVNKVNAVGVSNQINIEEKREKIKKDIAKALLVSNQTQSIYFVVRSMIMTILGAIITLAIFWQLGTINVIEDFTLGISTYVICLGLTRLFDSKIVNMSHSVLGFFGGHTKLRDFILKYF
jgi:hypothetical protein